MSDKNLDSDLASLPTNIRHIPTQKYFDYCNYSLENNESFWEEMAEKLEWSKKWEKVLEWNKPFSKWFVGGKLNASVNTIDRHLSTWRKNKIAYYWEGEPGDKRTLTYSELSKEVNKFAYGLKSLGIEKGDRIALYMPMIPEFPIAMLAANRIGATYTAVFSGFSSSALAGRIQDSEAKLVVTADGVYRRGKVIQLKKIVDEAVKTTDSVQNTIVFNRTSTDINMESERDMWWDEVTQDADEYVKPEPVESDHPLFILYTSGTTGKPKGVVHGTGGYLTYVNATHKWVFDVKDDDVYWCAADIGWITGHSYIVYGPLLHGLSSVMYEGALDYPNPERSWEIVDKYGVKVLYTSPTAIRSLMKHGDDLPKKYSLDSLRLLGTVGEPINPAAWDWYYNIIGKKRCPIVDTWWQTETGGILISPSPNLGLVPLKPGSATFPLPGIDAKIVNEKGEIVEHGTKGYIVIRKPWPGMLMSLYDDPERYKSVYWSKFPDFYYPGDYAVQDKEGYFWFLGRADEVLKVAGHRLGTIEIEDALVSHPAVAEAAVAGKPDQIKGEAVVAFVTLRIGHKSISEMDLKLHVRNELGPIAVPQDVYFVSGLPKTRSGKIMRRVVKAVASGIEIGDVTTLEDEGTVEDLKKAFKQLKGN